MKKNIKKQKKENIIEESSNDIEFDFSKIKNSAVNFAKSEYVKKYAYLLLLIIPIFLAAHFRLYPSDLPITEDWARSSIEANIKNNIASQINQQYPNLPQANKNNMINDNYMKFLETNQADLEAAVIQNSEQLKQQFKNDNGETYLLAIDPYYYYRQVNNLVETGHVYDEIQNSENIDNHMLAPLGYKLPKGFTGGNFHVWISMFWHKFLSFFNSNISVMGSFFYMPVIFSALSVIPAFFIARRAGGNLGGFFAAMIVGLHPAFLGRTPAGFSDTDAYNVFFPLLISWLFIEAFEAKDLKKKLTLSTFSGIMAGLYSFAWGGWWYIFDFILVSMIGYVIYYSILHRDELKKGFKKYISQENVKNPLIILISFFTSTFIISSFFKGVGTIKSAILSPLTSLAIQDSAKSDLWPNVYTTVAELNTSSLDSIINGIGGKFMFIVALIGMILTISSTRNKKNLGFLIGSLAWLLLLISFATKISVAQFTILLGLPIAGILLYYLYAKETTVDIKYAIFFTIWFLGTVYITTKGIRFLLLLVPVFGVSFGIAIGKFYRYIIDWVDDELDLNKKIGSVLITGLLLLLLITPIKNAESTALREVPSMNDGWFNTLDKIKVESAPDAIINSWWDFGHWFKAIGDRAVTFDGASQNTPMAHWIGKTLLTNSEDEAVGILRMLDCGSNTAFDKLKESGLDTVTSVDILYEVTNTKTDNEARKVLEENKISNELISEILKVSHCEPPENYFITSEDMIGKSGVWAHFGSWDFRRALIWRDYNELSKKEFDSKVMELGFSQNESTKMYYEVQSVTEGRSANTWIAPWPSYASGVTGCQENEQVIACQSGLIINKTDMNAHIPTQQGNLQPKTFSYIDDGKFVLVQNDKGKVLTGNDGSFIGASLFKKGDTYYSVLMNYELVGSIFNRLFYYDGVDLEHFEKFNDVRDVTGARIITWKINWNN